MINYTEADVARLADIIGEAQKRGIKHGSYTLARWILTAWQVEGSTPVASPPPAPVPQPDMRSRRQGGRGALATGGIITNPPPIVLVGESGCTLTVPAPADAQAPVPPPVDALSEQARDPLVDALTKLIDDEAFCPNCDSGVLRVRDMAKIKTAIEGLWAVGVAEGRRQATEEARAAAQISTFLDTEEGQLHLRKLIRTGQIVLPHG